MVQSRNPKYPVGTYVVANCGWRTHTLSDGSDLSLIRSEWPKELPLSLALGTIGMPGYRTSELMIMIMTVVFVL